jgi:glycosyltransferase involved in cell wall biosynthesis
MNILHLGKYYAPVKGGIESALESFATAGVKLGHHVTCLVANTDKQSSEEIRCGVKVKRIKSWGIFFSTPLTPDALFGPIPNADIIHLHLPNPFWEIRIIFEIFRRKIPANKIVPYLHAIPTGQGFIGRIWFQIFTSIILRSVNFSLASNNTFINNQKLLSAFKHKFKVIPFATVMQRSSTPRAPIVFALGRLVPYKGFDILLRAWRLLQDRNRWQGFQLHIAGDGPEREKLEILCKNLGISKSVFFLGSVSDSEKISLLHNSSLFVAPSLTDAETFGISILEAMATGNAVITSDLPTGVRELARGGKCGAIVKPGDIVSLANEIGNLISSPDKIIEIGTANADFAQINYSEKSLLENYSKLLNYLN